eukprot:TRINITY_DN11686_c0_g1_i1.p1 TRINITY_DN11686_c0_g1~~TRINITY_DN11686_c0_g1_i1.p1  ORF type:complete len:223 (+),score=31.41 TRINITY_DN11686_c0_g1_i1:192-860(+)
MQQASKLFIGEHNFLYFCKKDFKENQNYNRVIFNCEIYESRADSKKKLSIYALHVKGSAFLWHQIRCMMGILFKIGKGEQEPSYVEFMLDLTKCKARPLYELASERSLILSVCGFEDAIFTNSFTGSMETYDKVQAICTEKILDYCIYNTSLKFCGGLVYSTPRLLQEVPDIKPSDIPTPIVAWGTACEIAKAKKRAIRDNKKITQGHPKKMKKEKKCQQHY